MVTVKIELGAVLSAVDDVAWGRIEKAMAAGAVVADVGDAAAAVHVAAEFRRKVGANTEEHDRITAEYLECLSIRLQEIDDGDVATAAATAILITRKPVKLD